MSTPPHDPEAPEQGATAPIPGPRASGEDEASEVARLRAEVAALRVELDRRPVREARVRGLRRVVAGVLVFLAAFGLVATVIGGWAARTTLDTDRWVATVAPLPQDPQVDAAVSTYLTQEIVSVLDVEQRVGQALPPDAAFLAGPLTSQVRDYLRDAVRDVLATPQFAALWREANRLAHQQVVAIAEGDTDVVRASGDEVTLNLLPIVNEVLRTLDQRIPTIFGQNVDIPPVTSGTVPQAVRDQVESALGVQLPANFAQFTFYDGGRLQAVQDGVVLLKQVVWGMLIGSLVALALALWVSPGRRRTVLWFGVWLAAAVVVMSALLRAVRDQLLEQVQAGEYREGAAAALHVVFTTLRERGDQMLWLGILVAVVAYLVGPGRGARAVRRQTARGARATARGVRRGTAVARAQGPGFAARNLDALRVGGLVVAALVSLWLSSWTGLLVVVVLLAAYEGGVTLAARAGAAAGTGDAAGEPGAGAAPDAGTGTGATPDAPAGTGDGADASPETVTSGPPR